MICGNCNKSGNMCYLSNPPKIRCTVTNEFHYLDDECNIATSTTNTGDSAEHNKEENNTKSQTMNDGAYIELFAVKNGVRYNAKIIDLKDVSLKLTNSLMNGIEDLWR